METTVNIEGLHFGYTKKQPLFQELSLQLKAGHIYGLFGRNGTGKTTLLKQLIGGLFPQQGTLEVLGLPAQHRYPSALQELFMVPEQFELPALSFRDYVNLHAPFYPAFDHAALEQYIEEFELAPDQQLPKLSYGQQKKALLSFAMASGVRLLILDEPTNGLDIPAKSQFRKILAGAVTPEQTVLISTHQVRDLANLIDQVIILDQGQVVLQQDLATIGDRLSFTEIGEEELPHALYAEETLNGYRALMPKQGADTPVDLELLFNAVLHDSQSIQQQFEKVQV